MAYDVVILPERWSYWLTVRPRHVFHSHKQSIFLLGALMKDVGKTPQRSKQIFLAGALLKNVGKATQKTTQLLGQIKYTT